MPHPKKSVSDLALFGGQPLFAEPLYVGRPNICDHDALFRRIQDAVDLRWLTNDGPLLLEMEARFAEFLAVKHCIAVANATLGLQLLAHALELKGEVIMPSFTFIGTARAMEWQGLKPRFCDVLDSRHSLDPAAVRKAITPNVSAILGVHLWGMPCMIDELQAIADQYGIPLIFDAAHAIGSSYKGERIGRFGRAEVFSLHATKAINALEGGLIATDDDELAHRLCPVRNYGIVDENTFEGTGVNAKMNEFSAAMGLTNLEHFSLLQTHNRGLQAAYMTGLDKTDGIQSVTAANIENHNSHYAVFRIYPEFGLSRDEIREILVKENIFGKRYFWPGCHRCPPYNNLDPALSLPVTEALVDGLLQLPTGLQIGADDARAIAGLLAFIGKHADGKDGIKHRFGLPPV
ncbi:MAG: DegT/DnrJ/EryC1/StrS family aminotransferase [Methylococcales bacterium]|nr:DegT/DnrJ/EryC1/StrS family aminotransferase [Methylococcales bacterium]